jgi:hypothetical protein
LLIREATNTNLTFLWFERVCVCDLYIYFQLESVNWRLNLQMAQSNKVKMKVPNAMFEFNVTDENTPVSDDYVNNQ